MPSLTTTDLAIQAFTKKQLYEIVPTCWPDRLLIAKDKVALKKNSKTFYCFRTLPDFLKTLHDECSDKWYYELIEGEKPAEMYFDIEWYQTCEPFPSPQDVVREIIVQFQNFMLLHSVKDAPEVADWLLLCANSTNQKVKYSYHLICRAGWFLRSSDDRKNLHRAFVSYLQENDSLLCRLPQEGGNQGHPLDPSVYSGWQQLRTIWSTKMGSDRMLVPVNLDGSRLEISGILQNSKYFVTYIEANERALDVSLLGIVNPTHSVPNKSKRHPPMRRDGTLKVSDSLEELLVTSPVSTKTIADNDGSIEFYLKCIPNEGVGQPWEVYFGIVAAFQRAGGTYKPLEAWAAQSRKFDKEIHREMWQALARAGRPEGYDARTLQRLAKLCAPLAFGSECMTFTTRFPVHCYSSEYMTALPEDKTTVIAQSPMASGKTYGMAQLILSTHPARVLVAASRTTYAQNVTADLNDRLPMKFRSYHKVSGDLGKVPFLVIQMESLWRLSEAAPYDLLLIDEVEACLKQFSSPTMLTASGRLINNAVAFQNIYKKAKRRVLLDAFLSQRTIDVAEAMAANIDPSADSESVIVTVNEQLPTPCQALQYASYAVWEANLQSAIAEGKRVVVFWGSKSKGEDFEQRMRQRHPEMRLKFYHGAANDDLDKDLSSVRVKWVELQVLMYTSKVTVGVNFDVKSHFDLMFFYGCSGGSGARDGIQASKRVRHFNDNTLHYFISGGSSGQVGAATIEMIEDKLANKRRQIQALDVVVASRYAEDARERLYHQLGVSSEWGDEQEWLIRLHLQNLLEERKSSENFAKEFRGFLRRTGFTCQFDPETIERIANVKTNTGLTYEDIPEIDRARLDVFLNRTLIKTATAVEKMMITKHYFRCQLTPLPMEVEARLWTFWMNPADRKRLQNTKKEALSSPERVHTHDRRNIRLVPFMPGTGSQFYYVKKLLAILGVELSADTTAMVPMRTIEELPDELGTLWQELPDAFELRGTPALPGKINSCDGRRRALELTNKALTAWSNSRLVACKKGRRQVKVDGRKRDVYDSYTIRNKFEEALSKVNGTAYAVHALWQHTDPALDALHDSGSKVPGASDTMEGLMYSVQVIILAILIRSRS
ncbi:hypothetical protein HKX48_004612 [Thoreauomyces humboldtii]|nr:hypothetical protein HKX48_004612 [Thoreauomyces humboldtii]